MRQIFPWAASLTIVLAVGCASIKQFQTLRQPVGRDLETYVGGTILKIDREESLPNAFGKADVYGGKRSTGSEELKYLGMGAQGTIKLRVSSTDINTTEDWRRRLGNKGTVSSSSDAVDFEQDLAQPFQIEGITVTFLRAQGTMLAYKLLGELARR